MFESVWKRTEVTGAEVSPRVYNLIIGLVLCWGFGVNYLMVKYVPTEAIALLPQGESLVGEVVVFVSLRDDRGRQADIQRREQPVHLPRAEYERLAKLQLSVDLQLLVENGNYRIAVGLLDRLTRQASYQVLSASTP